MTSKRTCTLPWAGLGIMRLREKRREKCGITWGYHNATAAHAPPALFVRGGGGNSLVDRTHVCALRGPFVPDKCAQAIARRRSSCSTPPDPWMLTVFTWFFSLATFLSRSAAWGFFSSLCRQDRQKRPRCSGPRTQRESAVPSVLGGFFSYSPCEQPKTFFFLCFYKTGLLSLSLFFCSWGRLGSARPSSTPSVMAKKKDKARGKNSIRLARACGFSVGRWRRRRPPSSGEPAAGTRPGSVSVFFFLPTFSDDQRASSEGPPAAFRERALLL